MGEELQWLPCHPRTKANDLIIFYSKNSPIKFECKFRGEPKREGLAIFQIPHIAAPFELFKLNFSSETRLELLLPACLRYDDFTH